MNTIYFDNAATSWPKPDGMIKAMIDFNSSIGANPGRSGHRMSIDSGRIIFNTRDLISRIIGVSDPLQIILTRNATEALNIVINGLLQPGDHVITTSMEHNSVIRPLRNLQKAGVELDIVKCSLSGELNPDVIEKNIKKNTKAIFITHASNVTGMIMPVAEIAAIAKKHNIILCVDAAQTAGAITINAEEIGIDILAFTGHKSLYGPQGTGGLYIRKGLESQIRPLMCGGTGSMSEFEEQPDFMPDKFEAGTPNTIGIAGLGAGIEHILSTGVENIRDKEVEFTKLFIEGLQSIKGVFFYGNPDAAKRMPVVSFNIENMSPSDVSFELDENFDIMSRPGLHCAPLAHRTTGTYPQGTVRFSFGFYNTQEQILQSLKAIELLCNKK